MNDRMARMKATNLEKLVSRKAIYYQEVWIYALQTPFDLPKQVEFHMMQKLQR